MTSTASAGPDFLSPTATAITRAAADRYAGRTVLVTGGAGFIGSHLVRTLLDASASVRVLDDLSSGHRSNLDPRAAFLERSITASDAALDEAVAGVDRVFHLAAMVSVPQSVQDPEGCFEINVRGTERLLRAAIRARVRGFVVASSAAVYGPSPQVPSRETEPIRCVSPYAASKAADEHLLQSYAANFGLHAVSLRLFNIFGPRQDPKSPYAAAIAAFIAAALEGRTPRIFGDGLQTRDFTPVDNVVQAMCLAADDTNGRSGEVYNVGLGGSVTLLDVLREIGVVVGRDLRPQFEPPRAGDVPTSGADIGKIVRELGYRPSMSFAEGLRRTVESERARLTGASQR
jgi:UDP-glucose 4-epimerase